jgi:hypothetical protein
MKIYVSSAFIYVDFLPCLSFVKLENFNFGKWSQVMNKVNYFIFSAFIPVEAQKVLWVFYYLNKPITLSMQQLSINWFLLEL